mmetsp:Transcript_87932/g.273296  ORF Transcript_87932/g.273296 Transcript_87932/m.273296 type:complete len:198 (-) Transcript_87932:95-688(-)|eukprot:CAMPEP_0204570394 /NCGR_PEP_ID=MMETSP0661-20131031/38291_1 /ASSEMBLY_ACC=CAM_ASM_000606 /TAXON_ID=109239 /ORGANISM="Alexandrium margalefi, Strain AMGDE01CS-322" /LENGTH=197 /DNA_ID=CAMNT_0051578575 /DNA_START=56 /DNA_END=649 /DNA_ORIENTATION=+
MRKHRTGVSRSTVDLWRQRHEEKPNSVGGAFDLWTRTSASGSAAAGAAATAPPSRGSRPPHFEATSWQLGAQQGFDASGLGDKYARHSMKQQHTSRFAYLDTQQPLAHSKTDVRSLLSSSSSAPAREFDAARLKDKFGFHSCSIREPARWQYLDPARSWPRSADLKGRRFEMSVLGDKYSHFSTPISDVARFNSLDI